MIANIDHEDIENLKRVWNDWSSHEYKESASNESSQANKMADSHKFRREIPLHYLMTLVVFHKSVHGLYPPAIIRIS